jgi:hypothetical protein
LGFGGAAATSAGSPPPPPLNPTIPNPTNNNTNYTIKPLNP